ncbi:MAG: kinase [Romboutsia sp.]
MVKFDINGAIVEFDEKKDNYNSIRRLFKSYARDLSDTFEDECLNNIQSIKQLSDKGLCIGEALIDDLLRKAIECIVSYGIITIDFSTFKEIYCEKYLDLKRLFNNLNKEILVPNRNKKNSHIKNLELKPSIKKLKGYIYNDCFNIHCAVVDALIDSGISNIDSQINEDSIKKSNALFNNYKDGFISKTDECRVVKQIIELNPYRQDVYEFLIKEDGDFSKEVERLTEYLGYDIKPYKATLMDIYIKTLIENNVGDIEIEKEKVKKYSKYIGCTDSSIYVARIDAIYTFENA